MKAARPLVLVLLDAARMRPLLLTLLGLALGSPVAAQQRDSFPRDPTGHRVTVRSEVVTLAPNVALLLTQALNRHMLLFYCLTGHPIASGVMIDSMVVGIADSIAPACTDTRYVGGITVMPRPSNPVRSHSQAMDVWRELQWVLQSRPNFVLLITADSVLVTGPRLRTTFAIPVPVDTTPPHWKHET
jgi:hypothetical protein